MTGTLPQPTFLCTAEVPYAFFGFHPPSSGASTYSTFGIFRFTVLSTGGATNTVKGT
jgi:hypothetical protein